MATSIIIDLIPKLAIIVTVVTLNTGTARTGLIAAGEIIITPLWDMFANISNPCILSNANDDEAIFTGSHGHSCILQLNASYGTELHFEIEEMIQESFVYFVCDKDEDTCPDKYVVFSDMYEPCRYVTTAGATQLRGYGSFTLSISGNPLQGIEGNQSCNNNTSYSDKVMCTSVDYYTGYCGISFNTICPVTLGPREAIYHCNQNNVSKNNRVFIPYPYGVFHDEYLLMVSLSLSFNQITTLNEGCFEGLGDLKILSLYENKLTELQEGIFKSLVSLDILKLELNKLAEMNEGCFRGLSKLTDLNLYKNILNAIHEGVFQELSNLKILNIGSNQIRTVNARCFRGLAKLKELLLSGNMIYVLPNGLFQELINLELLTLSENQITDLNTGCFLGLRKLKTLTLDSNLLQALSEAIFYGLYRLEELDLFDNEISEMSAECLNGLTNLKSLYLSGNNLVSLPEGLFRDLVHLESLDITDNPFTMVGYSSFSSLSWNLRIDVSQHEICECFLPPNNIDCFAWEFIRSPYLTCDRLLSDKILAVFTWLIAFNALGGNIFVLIWRNRLSSKNRVNSILLSNLAVSDFLMGVYMCMIASADIYFGNNFPMQAEMWRTGITCRIAGALSIISSEASVFFVMLVSIDRFICIRFPYSTRKLSPKSASILATLAWILVLALGIIPSVLAGRYLDFYDNSHVCIGLPLTLPFDQQWYDYDFVSVEVSGHYYPSAVFLGLNSICYFVVLGCYIEIVRSARKTSEQAGRSPDMSAQLKLTRKVTAIVATDFCCWAPVIILGILVQTRVLTLPASVFAWCVTFVLPINSAINPYLYTVDELVSKYRKEKSGKKQRHTGNTRMTGISAPSR